MGPRILGVSWWLAFRFLLGGAEPARAETAPAAFQTGSQVQTAPLVVAIVVDQLASWVLRERIDKLPSDGGFARLRREGRYIPEMAYGHAITETAPGHASLFTGKIPREHGIIANDVFEDGEKRATIADGRVKLLTLDGTEAKGQEKRGLGSSLDKLDAKKDLVASEFRRRYRKGEGIIAALSLKDRGALFAAGEDADYAIWFDPTQVAAGKPGKERGAFVTTPRYAGSLAANGLANFVRSYCMSSKDDGRDGIERIEDRIWKGINPAWLHENADVPADNDYVGFVDSHSASQAKKPGAAFRALPDSDRLLFEMALQILSAKPGSSATVSGPGNLPMFLSLSLSANDYIGHLFGPDSWEAWDELRRLDATLGWFFEELDRLRPQAWSVILTADHGIVRVEEGTNRQACGDIPKSALISTQPCIRSQARGARIYSEEMKKAAKEVAVKVGLPGVGRKKSEEIIAGVVFPYIYLTDEARAATRCDAKSRARLASSLDVVLKQKFKGLYAVWDVMPFKDAPSECPNRKAQTCPDEKADLLEALVCHSISPKREKRGGDFYIVLKPGAFFDPDLIEGTGASHGSPYGYDRFVPLFVREPRLPSVDRSTHRRKILPFTLFHDELVRLLPGPPAKDH